MKKIMLITVFILIVISIYSQVIINPGVYEGTGNWQARTREIHKWVVNSDGAILIYINNQRIGDVLFYRTEIYNGNVLLTTCLKTGDSVDYYYLIRTGSGIELQFYHNPNYRLILRKIQ